MIVTSVQIKTAKTQKHLYCPVFTKALEQSGAFVISTEKSTYLLCFSITQPLLFE